MGEYYELLGIPKTATEDDVNKAYRKQAKRWHPDKHPENRETAELRFKEIAEAYQVLSNKEKRKQYDKYGKEGLMQQNTGTSEGFAAKGESVSGFRSPNDIFRATIGASTIIVIIIIIVTIIAKISSKKKSGKKNQRENMQNCN